MRNLPMMSTTLFVAQDHHNCVTTPKSVAKFRTLFVRSSGGTKNEQFQFNPSAAQRGVWKISRSAVTKHALPRLLDGLIQHLSQLEYSKFKTAI